MSSRAKGGMPDELKKAFILDALDEVSPDILDMLYRITFDAVSGLE